MKTKKEVKISLKLRDKSNPSVAVPVTLFYFFKGNRFHYSTGEKAAPQYWDAEEMRLKVNLKSLSPEQKRLHQVTNIELARQQSFLYSKVCDYKEQGVVVTVEILKQDMNEHFDKNRAEVRDLVGLANHIINESVSGDRKIERTDSRVSPNTIANYNTVLSYIKRFKGNKNIDSIGLDNFYKPFMKYCEEEGLNINSRGQMIRNIKTFLNYALKKEWTKNTRFKDFKIPHEDVESVALSREEIKRLYEYDLSSSIRLKSTRDLFILGCWTGLRISDLRTLSLDNKVNMNGKEYLKVLTRKTKKPVQIPLHKYVKEILTEYEGIPATSHLATLNRHLKKICEMVGFNDLETVRIDDQGKAEKKYKYQMVSMHTARRSFCTNLHRMGFPVKIIMAVSGHKSYDSFFRYIRIDSEEASEQISNHEEFRPYLEA